MTKITFEEKLAAVNEYLNGTDSYQSIADRLMVHESAIIKWVRIFQHHGENALRKKYTNYTSEFKLDVLTFMNETGASLLETAAVFNISAPSSILAWQRRVETSGVEALIPKKKGRPPMKEISKKTLPLKHSKETLQEEVERLRMENAYLKKLNALVREKERSPRNSKPK
jgi:transposase-like protein